VSVAFLNKKINYSMLKDENALLESRIYKKKNLCEMTKMP
jgi:hypothetical protein